MTNKDLYKDWCAGQDKLPIFFQPFWLDTVCNEGSWDVCISQKGDGTIQGVLPYYLTRYYGLKVIKMPYLTPYLGMWLSIEDSTNPHKYHSRYRKTCKSLLSHLPESTYVQMNFHPELAYLLPFQWEGYHQTTRYTFNLSQPINSQEVLKTLRPNIRNKINHAQEAITIQPSSDYKVLFDLMNLSFQSQGQKVPFELNLVEELCSLLASKNCGQLQLAMGPDDEVHAAQFLVWDNYYMYNLMLGVNTKIQQIGAAQLLLWNAIKQVADMKLSFDFEGSMIKSIHQMFEGFGGELMPYNEISRGKNRIFSTAAYLKRQNI